MPHLAAGLGRVEQAQFDGGRLWQPSGSGGCCATVCSGPAAIKYMPMYLTQDRSSYCAPSAGYYFSWKLRTACDPVSCVLEAFIWCMTVPVSLHRRRPNTNRFCVAWMCTGDETTGPLRREAPALGFGPGCGGRTVCNGLTAQLCAVLDLCEAAGMWPAQAESTICAGLCSRAGESVPAKVYARLLAVGLSSVVPGGV